MKLFLLSCRFFHRTAKPLSLHSFPLLFFLTTFFTSRFLWSAYFLLLPSEIIPSFRRLQKFRVVDFLFFKCKHVTGAPKIVFVLYCIVLDAQECKDTLLQTMLQMSCTHRYIPSSGVYRDRWGE